MLYPFFERGTYREQDTNGFRAYLEQSCNHSARAAARAILKVSQLANNQSWVKWSYADAIGPPCPAQPKFRRLCPQDIKRRHATLLLAAACAGCASVLARRSIWHHVLSQRDKSESAIGVA